VMHDGMPYGRNQGQGQGHSREVDRQSPTGLIFWRNIEWNMTLVQPTNVVLLHCNVSN